MPTSGTAASIALGEEGLRTMESNVMHDNESDGESEPSPKKTKLESVAPSSMVYCSGSFE